MFTVCTYDILAAVGNGVAALLAPSNSCYSYPRMRPPIIPSLSLRYSIMHPRDPRPT